jgi:hypothetical protein
MARSCGTIQGHESSDELIIMDRKAYETTRAPQGRQHGKYSAVLLATLMRAALTCKHIS